jgi:two-component system chemotaxis response regulator CheY
MASAFPASAQPPLESQPLRILVADASPVTCRSVGGLISTLAPAASVAEAPTAAAAAEILATGGCDLAFLDVQMPGIIAQAIPRGPRDGTRPFIVLTAQAIEPRWQDLAREAEAYELMQKPLVEREVRAILTNVVRMRTAGRALVADDSKAFRQLIRKILGGSRFTLEVDVVDDGDFAIGRLKEQAYDVVMLDYEMPTLDGLETACVVQEMRPAAKVVMISANQSPEVEKAARYFGAVDFLKKPFSRAEMERALHLAFALPLPSLLETLPVKPVHAEAARPAAASAA